MPKYTVSNLYPVYKADYTAKLKFKGELSKQLIENYGRGPFNQEEIKNLITSSLEYYVDKFETICKAEKSYTFHKYIFWLHEQVTAVVQANLNDENLPEEIDATYLALYRRMLKWIIEVAIEVNMFTGEVLNQTCIERCDPILDDLLSIGDEMVSLISLYAEQSMVEDLAEFKFKNDLYQLSRRHHYDLMFEYLQNDVGIRITKHVIDPESANDFEKALDRCLGINYEQVKSLIAALPHELKREYGEPICVGWDTFTVNMDVLFGISEPIANKFFHGLRLNRTNKMSLMDLICRPYKMNRFIYRPIVCWNIDGKEFAVFGNYAWQEAMVQLTLNAIPWGKAPSEWLESICFKDYVHSKEKEHDTWLDDEVEQILLKNGYLYDRNIKTIHSDRTVINIDVKDLGEVDFLVLNKELNQLLIIECKHLLGRYDIVNQRNDYNAFVVGSRKTKPYNKTLNSKIEWFKDHIKEVEEHFNRKFQDSAISLSNYKVEGIFIINGPTFYMHNSEFRIYTVDKLNEVINGTYKDPSFNYWIIEDDHDLLLNVKYPYFKKPNYVKFDPFFDLDEDV